ncbi:MAG TPA: MFS transporter [Alphaproteobacteria bacterium]|nr:MFS transporter [Alphaproteobacteria bacterium]
MSSSSDSPARVGGLAILSAAAFCSAATLRVADPLIPQIGEEFAVSVADAAVIATAFTFAYGGFQIVYGIFGDRVGKLTVIAAASLLSSLSAFASAFADGLPMLAVLRLIGGCTAGAIIPLAIAYVGDVTPYDQRQLVIARFLSGQVLGIVMGQALGGILAEHIGWRGVFAVFGGLFLIVGAAPAAELVSGRIVQTRHTAHGNVAHQYRSLLSSPRVWLVVGSVFVEGFLFVGAFTFVAAYLRQAYGLNLDSIGVLLAFFGLGALAYILMARQVIRLFGERGMVLAGGTVVALAFLALSAQPPVWSFVILLFACGAAFYMMHNTLQTYGTQMAPHARALGMSLFATCLFVGQAAGISAAGWLIERTGFRPVIAGAGVLLAALGLFLSRRLAAKE